ncbi:MAG: CYTH and CHAD domain-containing protein [Actinobacteria bacterium]|nr:CYTH and CHAD domain-containing protein [Actinomycetota bacterium]
MPEREVKLRPLPGFRLPPLHGVAEGLAARPDEILDLSAVYWDTPDLRLARSGASLRHRDPDRWTVKLPATSDGPLLSRAELTVPGDAGDPPAFAVDLVRAWVRTSRLVPVARLKTRRRRVELRDATGKDAAEVVDDEVTVLHDGHITARFREVEVELAAGTADAVADALVSRLRAAGTGEPDPTPKIVRALGWRATQPPDVVVPTDLGPGSSAREVVRAAVATSVAHLLAHDAGARLGDDPEMVHQARVASRRLRSDLRTFRLLLEPEWDEALRCELAWLGSELGKVRDTEVLLELLRVKAAALTAAERTAFEHLLERLVARWQTARIELLVALRSGRYAALLDRLVAAANEPALLPVADAPATAVLPALVRTPWKHLRRDVEALSAEPPDAALHAIRIRAKRLRYASEAVAPAFGKRSRDLAKAAAALQTVLGDHQDAVIAIAWLRDAARTAQTRSEAFVAGMVAGMVRVDERATRAVWPDAWARVNHKRLRSWL